MITNGKALIGMIHVHALPGAPRHAQPLSEIIAAATEEARQLDAAGFHAVLIENMHDLPYLCGGVGPEIVAAMTAVAIAVRGVTSLPLGVQILAAANCEALAVAHAAGASFIRAENFAYAHVADEGLMPTAAAGPLLRYRRQIGAQGVRIAADVKKKHASHALTADLPLEEAVRGAVFAGADAVIVTGAATGQPVSPSDLVAARAAADGRPVWVGSGASPENLAAIWNLADAFVVGSSLKYDGYWANPLDPARVARLVEAANGLRG